MSYLDIARQIMNRQAIAQVAGFSTDEQELFEERAAIMEHDGGLPRARAEAEALDDVRQQLDRDARSRPKALHETEPSGGRESP